MIEGSVNLFIENRSFQLKENYQVRNIGNYNMSTICQEVVS